MTRSDYSKSLAFELVSPELERRFENTCISREIRSGIERVLGKSKNLKETHYRLCANNMILPFE